jgi:ferredoxin-type protein NapH
MGIEEQGGIQVADKPFFLWRHLNKLRWLSLSIVFLMLVALPFLHVYQTYGALYS